MLGLVTSKRAALESKDELKRRIDEAARYVPLEQLCLSPQCGFSSTVEGNALTIDEQKAKLRSSSRSRARSGAAEAMRRLHAAWSKSMAVGALITERPPTGPF